MPSQSGFTTIASAANDALRVYVEYIKVGLLIDAKSTRMPTTRAIVLATIKELHGRTMSAIQRANHHMVEMIVEHQHFVSCMVTCDSQRLTQLCTTRYKQEIALIGKHHDSALIHDPNVLVGTDGHRTNIVESTFCFRGKPKRVIGIGSTARENSK